MLGCLDLPIILVVICCTICIVILHELCVRWIWYRESGILRRFLRLVDVERCSKYANLNKIADLYFKEAFGGNASG